MGVYHQPNLPGYLASKNRPIKTHKTHNGHRVDCCVVLLDEKLYERRVSLHGRVVETRPPGLRLGVDEGVAGEQGLAHLDAAVLGRQVERRFPLKVKDVDPAVVLQEELESRSSIIESEEGKNNPLFFKVDRTMATSV